MSSSCRGWKQLSPISIGTELRAVWTSSTQWSTASFSREDPAHGCSPGTANVPAAEAQAFPFSPLVMKGRCRPLPGLIKYTVYQKFWSFSQSSQILGTIVRSARSRKFSVLCLGKQKQNQKRLGCPVGLYEAGFRPSPHGGICCCGC